MRSHKRLLGRMGVVAAAGLLVALGVPGAATSAPRVTHESYTMTGVLADATWFSEEEPAIGSPQVLAVFGADADSVYRQPGSAPERMRQPAIVAIGLTMPGESPGDEPYQAELWCVTESFSFDVASDLSTAQLAIPTCDAQVLTFDPETGEETPNGLSVTLSATADWTATGPLESQRSHSRYVFEGGWTMDRTTASVRPAAAAITVTGLPGGDFEGTAPEGAIQEVRAATLMHQ